MVLINNKNELKFSQKYELIILTLMVLIFSNLEFVYSQQPQFTQISEINDVVLGKINAITQDKYGYMWFSDQLNRSLIRFDGNNMIQFKNEINNKNSLGGNYPECLFADPDGNIWIGFYGQGLDKYDPQNGVFTHFRHNPKDLESISDDFVSSVLMDHLGLIWVGTNSGLDCFNPKTGKFTHYKTDKKDPTSLSHNIVRTIYEDSEGTIWVGTGFPWNANDLGGLNRFNRVEGNFTRYMHDENNTNSLVHNKVRAILEDSKGNFWIGTMKDGLQTIDRKSGLITRYPFDSSQPAKLSRPALNGFNDHISFITEDSDKNLWIGTIGNGIIHFNTLTEKVTHYGSINEEKGVFRDNSGWAAYATQDGLLWLTTQENSLYKVDLYNDKIPFVKTAIGRTSFFEESPMINWIGTEKGLIKEDKNLQTSQNFVSNLANENSISNNYVRRIFRDSYGTLWFGTISGLNKYNVDKENFTRFMNDPNNEYSLSENNISAIAEDRDSILWIGTYAGGLNRFDRKTGKFIRYIHDPIDDKSLSHNNVLTMLIDESNNHWIGLGFNGGVNRIDVSSGRFIKYLEGHDINSIYEDSDHFLWVGTMTGLYRYDEKKDEFIAFKDENKGININSVVVSIVEDNDKNLWVITKSGLYKINKERDYLIHFGKESGVYFEDKELLMTGFAYKTYDGKLIFNQAKGYYNFHPDSLNTRIRDSKLNFTSFWLDNKEINPDQYGPLHEPIFKTEEINLNHDQNIFSLSFSVIDFGNYKDNQTYYKLENYDKNWLQNHV